MVRLTLLPLCVLAAAQTAFAGFGEQTALGGKTKTLAKWEWSSCGLDTDVVQVDSIDISPDPPVPGKDLTVTVKGTSREVLEDGAWADVTVKLGLIKLLSKRFDICEEASKANVTLQCPVEKGEHVVTHTVELPKEIPKAPFKVHVEGFMADESDMMCLDLAIDFRSRPFFGIL